MENAEEIQLVLERYSRLKPKEIPEALEEYMGFVAKTGDTVFKWPLIQHLFREKLMNVITDFHDSSPSITDLPHYPNVDPFNFDLMKKNLIERMESFSASPFTIQRICELLVEPRKQYSRIDKFMRAIEKNILVVSTTEPGRTRHESENGESLDSTVNGDLMSEGQLDVGSSEEDQTAQENLAPVHDSPNGTTDLAEPQTIDPLTEVDNADLDVPLEKLEPEVNVLTIETNEPLLKSIDDTTSDDLEKEAAQEVPETSATSSSDTVPEIKELTEVVPESETSDTPEEPKPEVEVNVAATEASPSKRSIEMEENEIPNDENVSKKVKIDSDTQEEEHVPEVITETIPTDETPTTNSNDVQETLVPETTESISPAEPTNEPTTTPEVIPIEIPGGITEVSPSEPQTSLILDATPVNTTIHEEEPLVQPLPPIETIVQETNMEEQQGVMTNVVAEAVIPTEDEDLMKVDTTPLISTDANKMQTDDVDETAASAMDVDECSGDFIME